MVARIGMIVRETPVLVVISDGVIYHCQLLLYKHNMSVMLFSMLHANLSYVDITECNDSSHKYTYQPGCNSAWPVYMLCQCAGVKPCCVCM